MFWLTVVGITEVGCAGASKYYSLSMSAELLKLLCNSWTLIYSKNILEGERLHLTDLQK